MGADPHQGRFLLDGLTHGPQFTRGGQIVESSDIKIVASKLAACKEHCKECRDMYQTTQNKLADRMLDLEKWAAARNGKIDQASINKGSIVATITVVMVAVQALFMGIHLLLVK